jgi:hypothetical protein
VKKKMPERGCITSGWVNWHRFPQDPFNDYPSLCKLSVPPSNSTLWSENKNNDPEAALLKDPLV